MKELLESITPEDWQGVLWGFDDVFEAVTVKTVTGQGRWNTYYSQVFKHKDSGNFVEVSWRSGSTEMQDCEFDPFVVQVWPKQVTITTYVYEEPTK